MLCLFHLRFARLSGDLSQGLYHPDEPPCRARLPSRQLPTGCIEWKITFGGEVSLFQKGNAFSFRAKSKIFYLHHRDHWIVIVSLHQIHALWFKSSLFPKRIYVNSPAPPQLDRIISVGIVAFYGGTKPCIGQTQFDGFVFGHHKKGFCACARHHAVEQGNWICDFPRIQILLHRERLFHQSTRVIQRIFALGDTNVAKALARCSMIRHVSVGQQSKARIWATVSIGVTGIHGKARKT